jgi:hypothetical protein
MGLPATIVNLVFSLLILSVFIIKYFDKELKPIIAITAVITPPKVARKDSFFDGGSKSELIMELVIGNTIEGFFLSSFFKSGLTQNIFL